MGNFRVLLQIGLLGVLILILQIPISWIEVIIRERQMTKDSAMREVSALVGGQQSIVGPFLSIPYKRTTTDKTGNQTVTEGRAIIAPDSLTITSDAQVTERNRGIFSIPVYQTTLSVKGYFVPAKLPRAETQKSPVEENAQATNNALFKVEKVEVKESVQEEFDLNQGILTLGVSDPKNIIEASPLQWESSPLPFEAGTHSVLAAGIHASIPKQALAKKDSEGEIPFSFKLVVSGSGEFAVAPSGKETTVTMNSAWPSPSFGGSYLPTTRTISSEGFKAKWNISPLGREVPDIDLNASLTNLSASMIEVAFVTPVDPHRMTDRAIKYELLILFLTFACFYLFQIFSNIRIHPIQYLLTGSALVLFYLLLLSLSEHLGFGMAYSIAATGALSLVVGYSRSILANPKRAWIVGGLLSGLYGFFYTLLREEEYSLLLGSIGLAIVLGVIMYISRKVDWYELSNTEIA